MNKILESETRSDNCCGGSAPDGANSCCKQDNDAKAEGKTGCGCGHAHNEADAKPAKQDGCC